MYGHLHYATDHDPCKTKERSIGSKQHKHAKHARNAKDLGLNQPFMIIFRYCQSFHREFHTHHHLMSSTRLLHMSPTLPPRQHRHCFFLRTFRSCSASINLPCTHVLSTLCDSNFTDGIFSSMVSVALIVLTRSRRSGSLSSSGSVPSRVFDDDEDMVRPRLLRVMNMDSSDMGNDVDGDGGSEMGSVW